MELLISKNFRKIFDFKIILSHETILRSKNAENVWRFGNFSRKKLLSSSVNFMYKNKTKENKVGEQEKYLLKKYLWQ